MEAAGAEEAEGERRLEGGRRRRLQRPGAWAVLEWKGALGSLSGHTCSMTSHRLSPPLNC